MDLGCVSHCPPIEIPLEAVNDGIHVVELHYKNRVYSEDVFGSAGDNFLFDFDMNENYEYIFSIRDTSGLYLEVDGFTCFKIKTKL